MKKNYLILIIALAVVQLHAQLRVGDPGVTFDGSKYDSDYPEMREWQKAGVQGGIPWLSSTPVKKTIGATNSDGLNAAITQVSNNGGGQLKLSNGTYTINRKIEVKSNVRIVGQSRTGVKLNITMTGSSGYAIEFVGKNAGIENLTIQGGHGTPNDFTLTDAKTNFIISSVNFPRAAENCWLDKVNIYNSGNSAISSWDCKHITIRDCDIQRSWNKGGGGHGYVSFQGSYMLMTGTHVKYMRHISIQNKYAKYNVLYDNNFEQEVSFHVADAGYNLVERNTITLPSGLGDKFEAIMTPWSTQHAGPGPKNAVYRNNCKENNHGGKVTFSDPNIVYVPKAHYQVFTYSTNTPKGGTFYPVNNVGSGSCTPSTIKPYVLVDNGSWEQNTNITVTSGKRVRFGPHPTTGGSWSWSGCGISGSDASKRDPNIYPTSSCNITATHTNSCGAKSSVTYKITVTGGGSSSNAIPLPGKVEAENYSAMNGIQTQNTSDAGGGKNVGWIGTGDWMDYKVNVQTAGSYTVKFRVASSSSNIKFDLKKGSTVLTSVNSSTTGGWQKWKTVTKTVNLSAGEQTLRILATGPSWNINYMDFAQGSSGGGNTGGDVVITIEAENFASTNGTYNDGHVPYGVNKVNGLGINWVNRDDWAEYNINVSAAGTYAISYQISTPMNNAQIQFILNGATKTTTNVPNNGQWDNYQPLNGGNVTLSAGSHKVRVKASGSNDWQWNLDKIILTGSGLKAGEPTDEVMPLTIHLYPNPVNNVLNIELISDIQNDATISIYNSIGTLVLTRKMDSNYEHISAEDLSNGIYILRINNGTEVVTKIFIKK